MLTHEIETSEYGRLINTMYGKRKPMYPFRCVALGLGRSLSETAEHFADHFEPSKRGIFQRPLLSYDGEESRLDMCFIVLKLKFALNKHCRKSAPGQGGVTNRAVKDRPYAKTTRLLHGSTNF